MSALNPPPWYRQPWFLWLVFLAVVLPLAYVCGFRTGTL